MIKRIRIQNVLSLEDVTVELGPFNVLIGRSGTGKSNFVRALRLLRDSIASGTFNIEAYYPIWWQAEKNKPAIRIGFEIDFDAPGYGKNQFCYSLMVTNNPDQGIQIHESLKFGNTLLFSTRGGQWLVTPAVSGANPTNQVNLNQIRGIREITVAGLVLSSGLGCYDFPGNVLAGENQSSGNAGLDDSGSQYLSVFKELEFSLTEYQRLRDINSALQTLNSSVENVDVARTPNGKPLVTHRFGDVRYLLNLNQESEGFRRFLAHMLALYQLPSKQTLVFEEPEKGIYPAALAMLAEEFLCCHEQGRGQVIITTHSPELLNHFEKHIDAIRVVEMRNGRTEIARLAKEQVQNVKDSLLRPGELLTVVGPTSDVTKFSVTNGVDLQ